MKSQIIRISKDTVLYGFGGVAQKLLAIFITPIIARILTPSDFGMVDLLVTVSMLIQTILMLGFDSALGYFSNVPNQKYDKHKFYSTTFYSITFVAILFCLISWLFSEQITLTLLKSLDYLAVVRLCILTVPFSLVYALILNLIRFQLRPLVYTGITIIYFILMSVLGIVLIAVYKYGVFGYFLAVFVSTVCCAILVIIVSKIKLGTGVSVNVIKQLLNYGLPLVLVSLFTWIVQFADRLLITQYVGLDQNGYYAIANKVSSVLNMIITAFLLAWGPIAFSISKQNDAKMVYARVLNIYMVMTVFVVILLTIFAEQIVSVFAGNNYIQAASVVGLLTFGLVFWGMYNLIAIGINLSGKNYHLIWIVGISAFVNIILNIILIPRFSITAAAINTLISYLLNCVGTMFIVRKYYPIPYNWFLIVLLSVFGFAVVSILSFVHLTNIWFIKFAVVAIYMGLIFSIFRKYLVLILMKLKYYVKSN